MQRSKSLSYSWKVESKVQNFSISSMRFYLIAPKQYKKKLWLFLSNVDLISWIHKYEIHLFNQHLPSQTLYRRVGRMRNWFYQKYFDYLHNVFGSVCTEKFIQMCLNINILNSPCHLMLLIIVKLCIPFLSVNCLC